MKLISSNRFWFTGLIILLLMLPLQSALAYLSPDTGSFIVQICIGAGLSSLFFVKLFWNRILVFFSRITNRTTEPRNEAK